jgi:tRNA threonylcarbamoyl adenosine modification protein YjeE
MPSTAEPAPQDPERTAVVHVAHETALAPLARRVAAALPRPAFIALHGDLGAGKTTFVKAVAATAGIDPAEVVSPTFGLLHEHVGKTASILHADMYRLPDADALWEIGWHDALSRADWAFVEWPERIGAALPADRLDVSIAIESLSGRIFTFASRGRRYDTVVDAVVEPDVP